ncbi:MAG: ATP-binding cassette domain-containing protein [Lachnospirales bacterium]
MFFEFRNNKKIISQNALSVFSTTSNNNIYYRLKNEKNFRRWQSQNTFIPPMDLKILKNKFLIFHGVGKTTLLKLISKEIQPSKGEICWKYNNYEHEQCSGIKIGFMSDSTIFVNDTIRGNILLGNDCSQTTLESKLTDVGLGYLIPRLDEKIDNSSNELSLGERKRLELTRILLRDFDVILFDEPTSNIDEISKTSIINIFRNLNDKIIIVTSHDKEPKFVEIFDYNYKIG